MKDNMVESIVQKTSLPSHYVIAMMGVLWLLLLSACGNTLQRLEEVGREPQFASVKDPRTEKGYQPVSWPTPKTEISERTPNSLWQPGSKTFFRDQRATREGDILTVNVTVQDRAQMNNVTRRQRQEDVGLEMPSVWGLERKIADMMPVNRDGNEANLVDIESDTQTTGDGRINRLDIIETQVAAIVTQVLPNGNLVISGNQEVLVNYELRQVGVDGVVRPEDIRSDNTIDLAQVAQARVKYGGRGTLSDVQSPRWGTQVLDIIMPF